MTRPRFATVFRWICTCVTCAFLVMWIASCWVMVSLRRFAPSPLPVMSGGADPIYSGWDTQAEVGAGRFAFSTGNPGPPVQKRHINWLFGYEGFWNWWFDYSRDDFTGEQFFVVPLWTPFLLAAIPTSATWMAALRAKRRRRHGICVGCGYDRQGLANMAPCPECGSKP